MILIEFAHICDCMYGHSTIQYSQFRLIYHNQVHLFALETEVSYIYKRESVMILIEPASFVPALELYPHPGTHLN